MKHPVGSNLVLAVATVAACMGRDTRCIWGDTLVWHLPLRMRTKDFSRWSVGVRLLDEDDLDDVEVLVIYEAGERKHDVLLERVVGRARRQGITVRERKRLWFSDAARKPDDPEWVLVPLRKETEE